LKVEAFTPADQRVIGPKHRLSELVFVEAIDPPHH